MSRFQTGRVWSIQRSGARSYPCSRGRRQRLSTVSWRRMSSHWTRPARSTFGPGGPSSRPRITRRSTRSGGGPEGPELGCPQLASGRCAHFLGWRSRGRTARPGSNLDRTHLQTESNERRTPIERGTTPVRTRVLRAGSVAGSKSPWAVVPNRVEIRPPRTEREVP
jgi:hypothetical protein